VAVGGSSRGVGEQGNVPGTPHRAGGRVGVQGSPSGPQICDWKSEAASPDELKRRAEALAAAIGASSAVVQTEATVGGGSLPGETLPSFGVAIGGQRAESLLAALRRGSPAVIGRIEAGRVILDLRTVEQARDGELAMAVRAAIG